MKIKSFLILLFFTIFITKTSFSQCCGAGNPVAGDADQKGMRKKAVKVFLFYKHSLSNTYYEGNKKAPTPNYAGVTKTSDYNYMEINLLYGITNKLSIHGNTGYFFNKSIDFKDASSKKISGNGIGDASLMLKHTIYSNLSKKFDITGGIGMKFPIGVFDQIKEGIVLPITVQPSSGSYKYIGNLIIFKGIIGTKFNLLSFNAVDFASTINSEYFTNFKYGNLYVNSIFLNYFFKPKMMFIFQLRNEYRSRDIESNEKRLDSGGEILIIAPAINYTFLNTFNATASFEMPIFRQTNGLQLGNKNCFSIRLSKDFGKCK